MPIKDRHWRGKRAGNGNDPYYYLTDTGCQYYPKCLDCPFPECLENLGTVEKNKILVGFNEKGES